MTAAREAGSGLMSAQPAGGALGAAISADGSAVAWTGGNAELQTRFLRGEVTDPSFDYYLWRQAPFGAGDPTRRITGIADPDDAVCKRLEEENPSMTTSFDQTSTGPCYGPLTDQESLRASIATQVPALSGDGYTVAFLTGAGPRPNISTGAGLDLYTTSMRPGLSRKEATTELTRDGVSHDPALAAPIESVAFSADGNELAIATVRTTFTLPVLQLVGAPRSIADTRDVYVIDLPAHTIERVTHSYEGGDISGDAQPALTLSADGARIAFSSFAGNLFFGDANQRPDAFVATRELEAAGRELPSGPGDGQSSVEEFGGGPRISARLRSSRGSRAVLRVTVPAPGRIEAVATASIGKGKRRAIADGRGKATSKGPARVVLHLRRRCWSRSSARARSTPGQASPSSRRSAASA